MWKYLKVLAQGRNNLHLKIAELEKWKRLYWPYSTNLRNLLDYQNKRLYLAARERDKLTAHMNSILSKLTMSKIDKLAEVASQLKNYSIATKYLLNAEFDNREMLDEQVAHLEGLAKFVDDMVKDLRNDEAVQHQEKILQATNGAGMFAWKSKSEIKC